MAINYGTIQALDKEILERLYLDEQHSSSDIAKLSGVTPRRIRQLLSEYNIPSHGRHFRSPHCKSNKNLSKASLAFDYWKEGLTEGEIAIKYGTHRTTICRLMKKWGILARKPEDYTLKQRLNIITKRKAKSTSLAEEVSQIERKSFQITPEYIVGLVDGEGSFSIGLDFRFNPPSAYCDFAVSNTHKETLDKVEDFLKFGSISGDTSGRKSRRPVYSFSVGGVRKQLKLAQFFLEHPLSIKAHAFNNWFQALKLIARNEHRTEQGFREIIWLKESCNAY